MAIDDSSHRTASSARRAAVRSPELRNALRNRLNILVGYAELIREETANHQSLANRLIEQVREADRDLAIALVADADPTRLEAAWPGFLQHADRLEEAVAALAAVCSDEAVVTRLRSAVEAFRHGIEDPSGFLKQIGSGARATPNVEAEIVEGSSEGLPVLIVNDIDDPRDMLVRWMAAQGLSVIAVRDVGAARSVLARQAVAGVLLDVALPGNGGLDVLQQLRSGGGNADVPVIMLSAEDEQQAMIACLDAGADDYLIKPLQPALLKVRLRHLVARAKERQRVADEVDAVNRRVLDVEQSLHTNEAEALALIRALPDLVMRCDDQGLVTEVHRPSSGLVPMLFRVDVGASLESGLPDDIAARFRAAMRQVEGGRNRAIFASSVTHQGSRYRLEIRLVRLGERNFLGIVRDVTERAQTEAELRRSAQVAEDAARTKSSFLAAMSHELRTPLNGVIGTASLLLDGDPRPDQREYLHTIRTCGDALLALIDQILDYSKIEAGRVETERIPFDPRDIAEEAAHLVANQAHAKDLTLVVDADDSVPQMILGDPNRLRQVLINVLANAVKFTDTGSVVLRQHWVMTAQGPQLSIAVTDTGIGMGPEEMQRLFKPFVQSDVSTTRRYGGTGLGLAISQRLCRLLGGDLTVTSEPKVGSCFTATITGTPASSETAAFPLDGQRVLVVQEDDDARASVVRALKRLGAEVQAATPDRAWTIIAESTWQAVVVAGEVVTSSRWSQIRSTSQQQGQPRLIAMVRVGGSIDTDRVRRSGCQATVLSPPRRAALIDAVLPGQRPEVAVRAESSGVAGCSVLIAEDGEINQRLISAMLVKLGCTPRVVPDGVQAVTVGSGGGFDLIFMDCLMPGLDGYEATRLLRARGITTPIVALTANALDDERGKCLAAGMDDYLSKPVRLQDLERMILAWRAR